jgi:hypothetical protein
VVNVAVKRKEREFPRFKVPLKGEIGARSVEIVDWSVGGLGLAGVDFELPNASRQTIHVRSVINGRPVEFSLNGEVVWTDPAAGRAGIRLLDGAEAIRPLERLADAYLAGRLISSPEGLIILDQQMSEKGSGDMAVMEAGKAGRLGQNIAGRVLGLFIFLIIGGAAFYFLASIVYERLFVFDALSASVAVETVPVVIPTDGVVDFADLPDVVTTGMKLGSVTGPTPADIISPCDCGVLMKSQQDQTFARAGQVVMSLVRNDAKPYVSLTIPFRRLGVISEGARISLTYLDGVTVENVKVLSVPKINEDTAAHLIVNVEAGRPLDARLAGQPVYARFDTAPWN